MRPEGSRKVGQVDAAQLEKLDYVQARHAPQESCLSVVCPWPSALADCGTDAHEAGTKPSEDLGRVRGPLHNDPA